jgi:hypothetical protein
MDSGDRVKSRGERSGENASYAREIQPVELLEERSVQGAGRLSIGVIFREGSHGREFLSTRGYHQH